MLRQFCNKLSLRPSHIFLQCRAIRTIPSYRHLDRAITAELLEMSRERQLITRMDRMLCLRNFTGALELFRHRISGSDASKIQTEATFEAACILFLDHKRVDEALDIYAEMQASGYRGTFNLQSTMLFIRCARSDLAVDDMIEALGSHIKALREDFSEAHLRTLLNELRKYGHDYHVSLRVVDHFLNVQDSSYRLGPATITHLINRSPEDPSFHEAKKWLRYHRENVRNPSIPSDQKDSYPYTAFIHFSNKNEEDSNFRYERILRYMSEDGVSPDSALLNVLIKIEVRRGNYTLAFRLYNMMSKTRTGSVQADAFTYCSLFDAFERILVQSSRSFAHGKSSDSVIPPRQLFFEMLCAFRFGTGDAPVGSGSLNIIGLAPLNQSLKVFMNLKDYAAAMIVLQTIANLGWHVDARTFDAVVHTLAKLVYREAFTSDKVITWSDHFMCLQEGNKEQIRKLPLQQLKLKVEQVGQIIADIMDPTIPKFESVRRTTQTKQRERNSPSVPQISPKYIAFLLEVLVRRALEASLGPISDISPTGDESVLDSESQIEADLVSSAREEMIPKLDDLNTFHSEPPMEDFQFL